MGNNRLADLLELTGEHSARSAHPNNGAPSDVAALSFTQQSAARPPPFAAAAAGSEGVPRGGAHGAPSAQQQQLQQQRLALLLDNGPAGRGGPAGAGPGSRAVLPAGGEGPGWQGGGAAESHAGSVVGAPAPATAVGWGVGSVSLRRAGVVKAITHRTVLFRGLRLKVRRWPRSVSWTGE